MSVRSLGAAWLLLLAAMGCGDVRTVSPTQTVVVIDAQDGVRAQAASLELVVRSQADHLTKYQQTFERGDGTLGWPQALALEPQAGDIDRRFEVEAIAYDGQGDFLASVRGISGYVLNQQLELRLMLEDECIGKRCAPSETCKAAACVDAFVDPKALPPYDATRIPEPMVVPAGERDAGMDAPRPDATVSGGDKDAGPAGTKPGCTPNPDTLNEVCPMICPEICNDTDDDCDRMIDEGDASDLCDLAHSQAMCVRGGCVLEACTDEYRDCDGKVGNGCEVAPDDIDNCGKCGLKCDYGHATTLCVNSQCIQIGCDTDFADCDSDHKQCETPLTSVSDCGRCGTECDNVPNATPSCATGSCGPGKCNKGFDDCDDLPDDGCEQPLNTAEHCGACDASCDLLGSVGDECSSGACVAGVCDVGFDDCDGDLSNGCESLDSDLHCGTCPVNCLGALDNVSEASCEQGACQVTCAPAYGDCDEDPLNGCEASLHTFERCSDCDTPCVRPHAVTSCGNGTCSFVACEDGWGDCNKSFTDGCEQDLDDTTDCGSCNNDCSATAQPFCAGRTCTGVACGSGTGDCDNDGASCEKNLTSDAQNCGACGFACQYTTGDPHSNSLACVSSQCVPACAPGFADCNGDYHDGCERALNTLTDCGGCGVSCAIPNATETCSTGVCKVMACDTDLGDCDGDGKSCETQLDTANDCGGCGVTCNLAHSVGTCAGGPGARVCAVSVCDQGYASCDDVAANGCETSLWSPTNCGGCASKNQNQLCQNLPNVTQTTCPAGSCQVQQCAADWTDCDGNVMNGCEQQVSVVGPCFPDSNCTRQTYQGRSYFTCTTPRTWSDARAQCNKQLLGDLVRIDDATENGFVRGFLGADSWIGASDQTTEGNWRWADNNTQFWSGAAAGTAVGSLYTKWLTGEPNDASSNEDCAVLLAAGASPGAWSDLACNLQQGFVCEVQADLCPSDPSKADPGQCGCGSPDTDTDGDGTANCHDNCPADPGKVATGVCGCGMADVDSDADGSLDCVDSCDSDPLKIAPLVCGCGVVESATDTDGDNVPNCVDACPLDVAKSVAPCGNWTSVSNLVPANLGFGSAPTSTLNCGTTTVDTTDPDGAGPLIATISNWCGTAPTPVLQTQASGPDAVVLPLRGLTINAGQTLRLIGSRPAILAVDGPVLINGSVDASASGITPGAGAGYMCGTSTGVAGAGSMTSGSGGGGGGFGSAGGKGGSTNVFGTSGGNAGGMRGAASLVPLYGGCGGGNGGACTNTGAAGGGAVQVSASGTLTVSATGSINAKGGIGLNGCGTGGGGGGGGSGGSILLEAPVIKNAGSVLSTVGGKGGTGGASGGSGAGGAGAVSEAVSGSGGSAGGLVSGGSGGGGGGGYGRIRLHTIGDGGRKLVNWTASNFTPQSYTYVQDVVISCNAVFNSSGASPTFSTWCSGTQPVPVIITQTGGPEAVVVPMKSFTVNAGFTLKVIGTRPVIFAADGDAVIYGALDGSAYAATAGAGGNQSCGAGTGSGGNGGNDTNADDGSGGGAGAGNAAVGGSGGGGHSADMGAGGAPGAVNGSATGIPLRGGCPGGNGGGSLATGGAGGGGIQVSSRTLVFVNGTGTIDVSGGGGKHGNVAEDGGGGGGSAGTILLEGYSARVLGTLRATGGAGARGNASLSANGVDGSNGRTGGVGSTTTQGGGGGGGGGTLGNAGSNGSSGTAYSYQVDDGNGGTTTVTANGAGGGGGGGSGGRTIQKVVAP